MSEWLQLVQNSELTKNFYNNGEVSLNNLAFFYIGLRTNPKPYIDITVRDLNPLFGKINEKIKGIELSFRIYDFQLNCLTTHSDYEMLCGNASITLENNGKKRIIYKNKNNNIILDIAAGLIVLEDIAYHSNEKLEPNSFIC